MAFKRNQYDCVKLFYIQQYTVWQRLTTLLYATKTAKPRK